MIRKLLLAKCKRNLCASAAACNDQRRDGGTKTEVDEGSSAAEEIKWIGMNAKPPEGECIMEKAGQLERALKAGKKLRLVGCEKLRLVGYMSS